MASCRFLSNSLLQTSSMASCRFLSNNLLVSVKPFLVLPNEFGPEEVIVSRPTLRILILASNGISSSSDESSLLKTAAIEGFFCTVRSFSSDVLLLPEVPNLIAKPNCFLGFSKALEADAMVLSLIEEWEVPFLEVHLLPHALIRCIQ